MEAWREVETTTEETETLDAIVVVARDRGIGGLALDKCVEREQFVVLAGEQRRIERVGGAAGDEDKVDGDGLGVERVDDVVQRAVAGPEDDGERRLGRQTGGDDLSCVFGGGGFHELAVKADVGGEEAGR